MAESPETQRQTAATVTSSEETINDARLTPLTEFNEDAIDVLVEALASAGELNAFGGDSNQRGAVELLVQQSAAIRSFYVAIIRVLMSNKATLDDTKDALAGKDTIASALESDEREMRGRIQAELADDARRPLELLAATRERNLEGISNTAVMLLDAEEISDPLGETAALVNPMVQDFIVDYPEDENVLQRGYDYFPSEQFSSDFVSEYNKIIDTAKNGEVSQVFAGRADPPVGVTPPSEPEQIEDPIAKPPSEQPGFMPESDPVSRPPTEMPGFFGPGPITSGEPVTFDNTGGLDPEDHQDIVEAMTSLFGAQAMFWNLDSKKLEVGVDANGNAVPADSESAVRVQHLLQYLVDNKISSDQRTLAVVQQTEWYQTTNASMRQFDAVYGGLDSFLDLNIENQLDQLGDIYDSVEDGFRQLGVQVDQERMVEIAATIDYLGYDMDDVEIASRVLEEAQRSQYQFDAETASFTEFAVTRDTVASVARAYYINLPQSTIAQYAQQLFTGEMTNTELHSIFREQASARFSNDTRVQNALQAGMTLDAYFAPYAGEIEKELGRPVDLFAEFPEVIEQMGSDGVARPMTYAEMRTFARQQPEWSQSTSGQDAAYNMVFELGKMFGVDA